jgi:hypothetical protein
MTVLDGVQIAAIALLGILVIGLLKSHAEILRQLHELGAGRVEENGHEVPVDLARGGPNGAVAHDIAGGTPAGEAAVVAVRGVAHDTLLAFLSSGCLTCAGFWEALAAGRDLGLPAKMRVVAVTKDPGEESESAIRGLSSGATVVMSTQAWFDYEVPGSPYFVQVNAATGRVSGEGTASTWEQVVSLVSRAAADARRSRVDASIQAESAHSDHIDHELMAAGILPGDPSLYPTVPPGDDRPGG